MKILLIANYRPDEIESMERFASVLEKNFTILGHQVRIIRPEPYFSQLFFSGGIKKWLAYIDKFILFPAKLQRILSWADVIHIIDHGNAVYTKYLQNQPHIVTCHDLLPIRAGLGEFASYKTGWTGKILQSMIVKGLNKTQKIACVSQQTQRDVMRLCSPNDEAVSLIPMGLNYPYSLMDSIEAKQRLESLGIPTNCPFILHVGANHWYKNRLGVLSIFYQLILLRYNLELNLVMVGKAMTDEMYKFIQNHHLSHKVIELVNINNEDLRAIYSSATALLFPSLQEGFGWPIIEAQACGCPVFTSNIPPMNNVGGEAAIYINPNNHKEAAAIIAEHLDVLGHYKYKSLLNSQRFTTKKMIAEYIKLYHQAINEHQAHF